MSRFPAVSAAVFESCVVSDPHNDRNKIVLYTMQCAAIGANRQFMFWAVARRFSEFVAFHKELKANWTLEGVPLPALPPKRLKVFGLDLSSKLRDSRSRALSAYMETVCKYQTTLANDAFLQDFFGLNLAVVLPPSTSSSESSSSKQCVSQEPEGDSALNLSLADVLADEEAPFVGNVLLRQSHSMDPVDGEADLQLNENETFDENPCSSTVIRRLSASTPLADVTSSGQLGVNQGVSRRSRHNLSSIYLSSLGSVGTRAHVVDVSDFGVSPILGGVGASVDAMPHDGNPLDVSLSRKAVARRKLELVLALAHAPVQEPANSSPSRLPPASDVPPTDPAIGIPANACEGIDRGPVLSSTCHMQGPPSDWLAACGIPPSLEYCDDPDSHDNVPSTMSAARSATTDANTHVVEDEIAGRDSDENPGVTPVVPDDVSIAIVEDAFVSKRQQQGNEADELRGAIPLPVSAVVLTPSNSGVHCTEPSPRDDVFSGVEAFGGKRRPVDRRKTRKGRNPHKACVGCVVS